MPSPEARRSGTGAPPEDCTCILNQWEARLPAPAPVIGGPPPADAPRTRRHWTIHIADPACPHHGDRRHHAKT